MTREQALEKIMEESNLYPEDSVDSVEWLEVYKALEPQKPLETFENTKDHICKLANDYKCWDNRLSHEESLELYNILEHPTPTQRWIPVSERLPEDGTWNLFTDGKKISIERYKLDAIDHFYPSGRFFSLEEAIAWQPLPERYKEKQGNNKPKTYIDCQKCENFRNPDYSKCMECEKRGNSDGSN